MSRAVTSILALLLLAAPAHAQRGVQWAPDRLSRLISKDVGGERWAISVDEADGTIVGNVFRPDGGPPQFVWCWPQSTADDPVRLRCSGTTGCDPWVDLGEIELPGAFLAPPASCEVSAGAVATTAGAAGGTPGSALRTSPDDRRTLISKDVDGLRWAMVYDPERFGSPANRRPARLTGNVFDPAGGDPQFVACEAEDGPNDVLLRCTGAAACPCGPCAPSEWTPLPEVRLPRSFLEERRCPVAAGERPEVEAVLEPQTEEDAGSFGGTLALAGATVAVAVPSGLYVFERSGVGWERTALLPAPGERFARGVATDGDTIAVGDDHRVRLYGRSSSGWRLAETLDPDGVDTGSVAVLSDGLLVQWAEDDDDRSFLVTYERGGASWRESDRLAPPDDLAGATFGAVALDGAMLAATVFAGIDVFDEPRYLVLLYERAGGAWVATERIERPAGVAGEFGRSVALAGRMLLVGAPPTLAGSQRANDGSVLVYERSGGWAHVATLRTCAEDAGRFGSVVAASDGVIAVGAATFADGQGAGDAYLFERDASGCISASCWRETRRASYADAAPPAFGTGRRGMELDGTTLVAGAAGAVVVVDAASPELPPASACPSPAKELWPVPEWRVDAPAAHAMNPVLLERAREYAFAPGRNTQGVVVVRHGAIVAEWYEPGRDAASFAASWSTAKSVASAVIGIALDRGEIPGLDASMAAFYPSWAGTPNEAMTLRDVLTMTSGLDWSESYATDPSNLSDIAYLASVARDQLSYVVGKPLAFEPGTYHSYSSGDTMLLSGVIEAAVGTSFGDYARRVLFDPLGMTRAEWWTDAVGHTLSYCCLDAPSREFARFGLLYARGGRWLDRQLVSREYVDASLEPTITEGPDGVGVHPYGFQWWLGPTIGSRTADAFHAVGWDVQRIFVFPSLDLVVVRHGHYDKDPGPPIADPSLFARYPSAGLVAGRGTVPPESWSDTELLEPILGSIVE